MTIAQQVSADEIEPEVPFQARNIYRYSNHPFACYYAQGIDSLTFAL